MSYAYQVGLLDGAYQILKSAKENLDQKNKEFGKAFRAKRQEKGLSLRDCAKKLGLSAAYISDVELGRRNANQTLIKFFK